PHHAGVVRSHALRRSIRACDSPPRSDEGQDRDMQSDVETPAGRLGFTGRLSTASARHPWRVIAAWVAGLVIVTALAGVTGSRLTTDIEFSNAPESQVARELLQEARGAEPFYEQVIVQSDRYTVDDPEFQAFAAELMAAI